MGDEKWTPIHYKVYHSLNTQRRVLDNGGGEVKQGDDWRHNNLLVV